MSVLTGVLQYLIDRHVEAKLYNGYLEITRNTSKIQLFLNEFVVECLVMRLSRNVPFTGKHKRRSAELRWDQHSCKRFDLTDPNSLQAIFEFVMSKENK